MLLLLRWCLQGENLEVVAEKFCAVGGDFGSHCIEVSHFSATNFLDDSPQTVRVLVSFLRSETLRDGSHLD